MNTLNTQSSSQPFAHDLTEVELVAAAQQGDPHAFERIMRQHNRLLFRSARSILKNDDDTEDAVQAAYLSAWRAQVRQSPRGGGIERRGSRGGAGDS